LRVEGRQRANGSLEVLSCGSISTTLIRRFAVVDDAEATRGGHTPDDGTEACRLFGLHAPAVVGLDRCARLIEPPERGRCFHWSTGNSCPRADGTVRQAL